MARTEEQRLRHNEQNRAYYQRNIERLREIGRRNYYKKKELEEKRNKFFYRLLNNIFRNNKKKQWIDG